MKYFHLIYLITSAILFSPFVIIGWAYQEAQLAFWMGRNACKRYMPVVERAINKIGV